MQLKTFRIILFSIVLVVSIGACRKDNKPSWDISVLAPLINTSLSLSNILADSLIQVNTDTSLKIVYNTNLYSFSVDSLVNIPDTITYKLYNIPFIYTFQPGQQVINNVDNKHLDFGDAKISKVIVKSGFINLKVKNTVKEKMLCKYQISSATLNGIPFELNELIPAADVNGASVFTRKMDISGYTLDLTGPGGSSVNVLSSVLQSWVDINGSAVSVSPSDSLQIMTGFESIVLDYAKGYFGSAQFQSGMESSTFDLFNKINSGSLKLEDIHAGLTISNGFGVDASLYINEIKSFNSITNNSVSLVNSVVGSTININRAQETYNPASPVLPSQYNFNLDNSNFKQLLENMPDRIDYSIDISTNPLGNVSCGNDFVYSKYGFDANLDLEIPLSLIANNLTLIDTLSFKISKPEGYEINFGTLTLIADNGFPFSATMQLFLLDENDVVTDSLIMGNKTIASAPLNSVYKVTSKKRSVIIIPVPALKLERLYNAKSMKIVARFNTAGQPHYVKIYSDYGLDMKLTGDFNMTVNKK